MKFEWRKQEKDLYIPKQKPEIVTVPKQKFFMIQGKGDPNHGDFAERVGVLYSLAYAIRMMPRNGYTPEGYFVYTVYPLEGIWDLTEEGRQLEELNKDELLYTIMIRQPDFVSAEVVDRAFEQVREKKPHPLLDEVTFETIEEGMSLQMLHVGPFENEPQTFEKMEAFLEEEKLERVSLTHREIYLSDMRRVEPSKLKTVLRFQVKPVN